MIATVLKADSPFRLCADRANLYGRPLVRLVARNWKTYGSSEPS